MVAHAALLGLAVDLEPLSHELPAARLAVLGATGSVGRAALDVAAQANLEVVSLAADSNVEEMARLCRRHQPAQASLADPAAAERLASMLGTAGPTSVTGGAAAAAALAAGPADTVVAAIAGVAGVASTVAAVRAGKRVLLANKESLIIAGRQLLEIGVECGAEVVPVDSEHGALLELLHLARDRRSHVAKVWLTASGGPFRELSNLDNVTPEMACAHPVWDMGTKISVDSASLMNKGLEVIEACLLFDLVSDQVEVVIHPQGIVHAIVEFADGSSIAQCGPPDMRAAVARAVAWPQPHRLNFGTLDWRELGRLEFYPPDHARFPCLHLARAALEAGGVAPAVLNAANEVAVAEFVNGGRLRFTDIPVVVEHALAAAGGGAGETLDDFLAADATARRLAVAHAKRLAC